MEEDSLLVPSSHTQSDEEDGADCSEEDNGQADYGVNYDYQDNETGEENNSMIEISQILKAHDVVSLENALALNKVMQAKLTEIRDQIVETIMLVKERYKANEKELKNPTSLTRRSIVKGEITATGSQFFKDISGKHCPPNDDYFRRRKEGEMFPMDFGLRPSHIWTLKDKVGIIQGIKEQVIEYLKRDHDNANRRVRTTTKVQRNVQLHTLKLCNLLKKVDDQFEIDWHQISMHNLKYRHSIDSCFAMWNVYLRPELNRNKWTSEEEITLCIIAKRYNLQNWSAIAAEIGNRSDYQCFIHCQTALTSLTRAKFNKWTKLDDNRLLELVNKYSVNGLIPWNRIASYFPNRTKSQCHSRYIYSINPNIKHRGFTPEEDCILLAAVEEYGENFQFLPKSLFPNRTVVQLRNRYNNALRTRNLCSFWTVQDDQRLLDLVEKHGVSNWKLVSENMENHTRISCRTRYIVISKFLETNPGASLDKIPRKKRPLLSNVSKQNWAQKIIELKSPQVVEENTQKSIKKVKKPTLKRSKKENYRDSLRAFELNWYDYFKYSYDFVLGKEFNKTLSSVRSLDVICSTLSFQLPLVLQIDRSLPTASANNFIKLYKLRSKIKSQEIRRIENIKFGHLFPPNWSTMMGFRALCIKTGVTVQDTVLRVDNLDCMESVKKFRSRLKALFFMTALLSRLDPKTIFESARLTDITDTATTLEQTDISNLPNISDTATSEQTDISDLPDIIDTATSEQTDISNFLERRIQITQKYPNIRTTINVSEEIASGRKALKRKPSSLLHGTAVSKNKHLKNN